MTGGKRGRASGSSRRNVRARPEEDPKKKERVADLPPKELDSPTNKKETICSGIAEISDLDAREKESAAQVARLQQQDAASATEEAAVQEQKGPLSLFENEHLDSIKKKHDDELEHLKKKHALQLENLRKKHEEEVKSLMNKQLQEVDDSKKAERTADPDPLSSLGVGQSASASPSPVDPLSSLGVGQSASASPSPLGVGQSSYSSDSSSFRVSSHGSESSGSQDIKMRRKCEESEIASAYSVTHKNTKKQQKKKVDVKVEQQPKFAAVEPRKEVQRPENQKELKQKEFEVAQKHKEPRSLVDGDTYANRVLSGERSKQELARQQEKVQKQRKAQAAQELEENLIDFLNSYEKRGISGYYKKRACFMKTCQDFNLRIEFQDLFKYDVLKKKNFATTNSVYYANKSNSNHLVYCVRKFLISIAPDDIEWKKNVECKGHFTLINIPSHFVCFSRLLKDNVVQSFSNIFGLGFSGNTFTHLACVSFGGMLGYIFSAFFLGKTWRGEFTLDDLYAIDESQFGIAIVPYQQSGNRSEAFEETKKDACKLVQLFETIADCREPERRQGEAEDCDFPLYFPELRKIIYEMTRKDFEKPWFREFVLNFPCLKLSLARHNLVCGIHTALQGCSLDRSVREIFSNVIERKIDWREGIRESSNSLLREIYEHNDAEEPFCNTLWGISSYDRNLKQHLSRKAKVSSIAEMEVFSTSHLHKYLHVYLKALLQENLMSGDFGDIWINYKNSTSRTIDGALMQPRPSFTFWEQDMEVGV